MRYNNDFRGSTGYHGIEVLNAHVYDCTVLTNTRSNDAVYVVCRHGGGVGGGGAGDWRGEQRAEAGGCVCVCGLRPKMAVVWKRLGQARVTLVMAAMVTM